MEDIKNNIEKKNIPKSITTAKGSVYTYLEDGRTQRYKATEEKMMEPQDILVFIPPVDQLDVNLPHYHRLPDWIKNGDVDEVMEKLASLTKGESFYYLLLTNGDLQPILNNYDAREAIELLLTVVDKKENKILYVLPVTTEPQLGASTYDASFTYDEDGKATSFYGHIGNQIVSIDY